MIMKKKKKGKEKEKKMCMTLCAQVIMKLHSVESTLYLLSNNGPFPESSFLSSITK